jgi:hypothetical protein
MKIRVGINGAAKPDPPREPGGEPRDLLGYERGRAQREEQGARCGPAGRHRLERPTGRLHRVGEVAGEAAVVFARHHAVEAVLAEQLDDVQVGDDAIALLALSEQVVELNVTPDRGYCLSVRGVAS